MVYYVCTALERAKPQVNIIKLFYKESPTRVKHVDYLCDYCLLRFAAGFDTCTCGRDLNQYNDRTDWQHAAQLEAYMKHRVYRERSKGYTGATTRLNDQIQCPNCADVVPNGNYCITCRVKLH